MTLVSTAKKIHNMLEIIRTTPFFGIGKPEPSKANYSGYRSRRVGKKHRMMTHDHWIRLGQEHRQKEEWGDAINAYQRALALQPEGPAKVALEFIYEILAYRNTDLINP